MRISFYLLVFLLSFAAPSDAQEPATTLLADRILYSPDGQTLTAEGHVEIFFEDTLLRASRIIYNDETNRITATGPLILTRGDKEIILADMAEISTDLRNGLITGARILLEGQLQLAAQEMRRTGGRYTTLRNVVGSYCQICETNPTPVWQIRARRVIHDTQERQIYFEGAKLEMFGFPVAYLPTLRIPDPTVSRASGFLTPEFINSDLIGFGVRTPYYFTLGDHADATIAPFVTTEGVLILEGEYRRAIPNGKYEISGVFAVNDGLGGGSGRGFLQASGNASLDSGFETEFDVNIASDKSFMRQFDYSDADRLTSEISFNRFSADEYTSVAFVGFQTLRDTEDNDTIPFVLPEFQYRRRFPDSFLGGEAGLELSGVGLYRTSGRDMIRVDTAVDWRRDWILPAGIILGSQIDARIDAYEVWDDPGMANGFKARFTPAIGAELRWPWSRQSEQSLQIIEPVIQLVFTPDPLGSGNIPNEDSQQLEFDTANLFSFDRFAGNDLVETGFRANIGVNYTRIDPDGWSLGLIVGQVFRASDDGQFSAGSGLNGTSSDIVAAATLDLPPYLQLSNRIMFDNNFTIKRNEAQFAINGKRSGVSGTYAFLSADAAASAFTQRHEIHLTGRHQLNDNWKISANWRRDLESSSNISFGGTLSYGNECIEVDFSAERSFTTSTGVPPTDTFGLKIQLAGFGRTNKAGQPRRNCHFR